MSPDREPAVLLEKEGAIGWLRFNRPDAGNAIDLRFSSDFLDAVIACEQDCEIRVVVLSARGKFFCVGGDLASIHGAEGGVSHELRQITARMHEAISMLLQLQKPLVSAINGTAAGAGLSLAICADIAIAHESARFKSAFTAIGLSPDCGTTYFLPRLIGLRKAQALCLQNPTLTASEAEQMSLVTEVVSDGEFDSRVNTLARDLARAPTLALGSTRRLLQTSLDASLVEQMEKEGSSLSRLGRTRDADEGMAAFLEKRDPDYRGS